MAAAMTRHIICFYPQRPQKPRAKPSVPPVPTEEDTLQFLDEVIASCDSEPQRCPYRDDGHADVDFIGELLLHPTSWGVRQRCEQNVRAELSSSGNVLSFE